MKSLRYKALLLIVICACNVSMAQQTTAGEQKYIVRITDNSKINIDVIQNAGIQLMWQDRLPEAQAIVTRGQADWMISKGINVSILSPAPNAVDPEYHSYDEMWSFLDSLAILYPELMRIDTLGFSHLMHLSIPLVKISDNPQIDEDEAVIYYDGMHHAREPVGMETCLKIMDRLVSNYSTDPQVKKWVDQAEIYIVPCMNPDGWEYIVDSALNSPWWRKNMDDNNGNGIFEPGYDGVDLNRNYNYYWEYGDPLPGSELYHGLAPFSETEITGKRDFMLSHKPVLSITYHSYGEIVYYVRYIGYFDAPDWPVAYMIGNHLAGLIPCLNGSNYFANAVDPMQSESLSWCYQAVGTLEFLIETSDVFIPSGQVGQQVASDNLDGALYLLERAFKSGITGHARDGGTGEPLVATVEIVGTDNDQVAPRTCESLYGRYFRLLLPGTYTVRAFAENTDTVTVNGVEVTDDTLTTLDFYLTHTVGVDESAVGGWRSAVNSFPNPFSNYTTFEYVLEEPGTVSLNIFNHLGQEVEVFTEGQQAKGKHQVKWFAEDIPAGIYFYRLTSGNQTEQGKIVIVK